MLTFGRYTGWFSTRSPPVMSKMSHGFRNSARQMCHRHCFPYPNHWKSFSYLIRLLTFYSNIPVECLSSCTDPIDNLIIVQASKSVYDGPLQFSFSLLFRVSFGQLCLPCVRAYMVLPFSLRVPVVTITPRCPFKFCTCLSPFLSFDR
jgi:hypothetical protein